MTDLLGSLSELAHLRGQALPLVPAIEVAVIAAAVLAVLFYRLRQPALLAYIVAGLGLGIFARALVGEAAAGMEQISHLGLVFLLFIIGLELDLKGILKLGPRVAAAVLLQAPLTIAVVWGAQRALISGGFGLPGLPSRPEACLIFAVAIALSSTAVVVKLLGDKFDLTSQAGRVTVLTLIAQDIWAVLALSAISSLSGPGGASAWSIVAMLGGAVAAALALALVARLLLSRLMAALASSPDMIAFVALAWCFVGSALLSGLGLSAEMGALLAGLTLGSLPVATEVLAKVSSLRDFFMALYFVALGMSLPPPSLAILAVAAALIALVLLSRLALFVPLLAAARLGPVVSVATAVNLSQLSEFALLLVPIGIAGGVITRTEGATISYAMMLSILLSTYGIKYNYALARAGERLWGRLRGRSPTAASGAHAGGEGTAGPPAPGGHDVLWLGYFRTAEHLARMLGEHDPALRERTLVIDYNLANHARIRGHGLAVAYGDIANPETLRHHGIDRASVILCTIGDTFLRGTSNRAILSQLRLMNPRARVIVTAETEEQSLQLLRAGAFAVISHPATTAPAYYEALGRALHQGH